MPLIINAGSGGIPASGNGWTNTLKEANKKAYKWYETMRENQIDVIMTGWVAEDDGRFKFTFRHNVTGVEAHLRIDGVDDMKAYESDGFIFTPRIYWNGCSTSSPAHEDFLKEGYVVQTKIVKADNQDGGIKPGQAEQDGNPSKAPTKTENKTAQGGTV